MRMMFIVALYLLGVSILKLSMGFPPNSMLIISSVCRDPGLLLRASRFTAGYVQLVGHEPAPAKCALLSTSRAVRRDVRDWVLSEGGATWTVKVDVRDLGRGGEGAS